MLVQGFRGIEKSIEQQTGVYCSVAVEEKLDQPFEVYLALNCLKLPFSHLKGFVVNRAL